MVSCGTPEAMPCLKTLSPAWRTSQATLAPAANSEHQFFAGQLTHVILQVVLVPEEGLVFPGCNVTDRETNWKKNYRCPDVAVFLKGNLAQDRDTHWYGGPDFAIEIVSPG